MKSERETIRIAVIRSGVGWAVEAAALDGPQWFLNSDRAEAAAKHLARRLAAAGAAVELEIDGTTFVVSPPEVEPAVGARG